MAGQLQFFLDETSTLIHSGQALELRLLCQAVACCQPTDHQVELPPNRHPPKWYCHPGVTSSHWECQFFWGEAMIWSEIYHSVLTKNQSIAFDVVLQLLGDFITSGIALSVLLPDITSSLLERCGAVLGPTDFSGCWGYCLTLPLFQTSVWSRWQRLHSSTIWAKAVNYCILLHSAGLVRLFYFVLNFS